MAEYIAVPAQVVALNQPVIFTASIPCNKGIVIHDDGTGIFILRGATNNCFARYEITFNGNIAIPTGGALSDIAIAISQNGETRQDSLAIFSPAAVDTLGNVTSTATVTVPRGCCFNIAARYVPANATETPTPAINVQNASLRITRVA